MWNEIQEVLDTLLGNVDTDLNAFQMAMRAVVTFVVTVAVVRAGNKRLFGKGTAYDTVVAIMIGSVMSRAITASGSGTMLATWTAGLTLIAMHWMLSTLSYHIDSFGSVVKGHEELLVKDGQLVETGMRETSSTLRDLHRAIRQQGSLPDVSQIQQAYMERDGSISIIPASSGPKVIEVDVRDGVQTVRIALDQG